MRFSRIVRKVRTWSTPRSRSRAMLSERGGSWAGSPGRTSTRAGRAPAGSGISAKASFAATVASLRMNSRKSPRRSIAGVKALEAVRPLIAMTADPSPARSAPKSWKPGVRPARGLGLSTSRSPGSSARRVRALPAGLADVRVKKPLSSKYSRTRLSSKPAMAARMRARAAGGQPRCVKARSRRGRSPR